MKNYSKIVDPKDIPTKEYVDEAVKNASGITEHNKLSNRDMAEQHPISAITGLQEALDSKVDKPQSDFKIWTGSIAEYDEIEPKDLNTLYFIY